MTSLTRKSMFRLPVLLLTLLAALAGVLTPSKVSAEEGSILEGSWPRDGVSLWVPVRETTLRFTEPVDARSVTLTLSYNGEAPEEANRITTGESVESVLFRIPITRAGDYAMNWQATTTTGVTHSGVIDFSFGETATFVGGQNHRHGDNAHLIVETPQAFALRLLFVLPVAVLLGVFFAQRVRGSASPFLTWAVRTGGGLLVLAALVGVVASVADSVFEYHDYPLLAALSAPGFMLFPALLAVGVYLLVTGRTGRAAVLAALVVAAVRAGAAHPMEGLNGLLVMVSYFAVMITAASSWALASFGLLPQAGPRDRSGRWLAAAASMCALSSLAMLFLHARTFDLRVDFASDFAFRMWAVGVLTVSVLLGLLRPKARPLRVALGAIALVGVLSAAGALVWMPPPAAGL